MPVRLRITFLFTLVVFFILGIVCTAIYYFSYTSRIETIKTRLVNRAITTAGLLGHSEIFDRQQVERIDSLTTIAMKNKSVQGYNYQNKKVYNYSELPGDTVQITSEILDEARINQRYYFTEGKKEAVAYHYTDRDSRMVIICAGYDEDGKANLGHLKNILLLSFIAGIVITLIGGYFFSKRLLQPVRKITHEVTDISAHDLTRRIQTGSTQDEWHQLSTTLNDLLNRLQESFEVQRRFISNASHELSTPLTSISSQLEISLQRERTEDEYRNVMSSVLQDVRRMNKLTQTLLELAKATGDKGGLNLNLTRIDEIVLEIPATMQKQNAMYQVFLRFGHLPENEEELLVFGNAELLFTALKNIVTNACKYSPDHRAEITLVVRDKNFVIIIEDKGVGIAPKDLSNIFQPFYRVDETRVAEGFGLGLSLVYRIIKLHKGDITVQSVEGQGTVFTIYLPSAR